MLVSADLFTQLTESDVHLFQKHPHRHTQKYCFTSYLGIPVKLAHSINHHSCHNKIPQIGGLKRRS